ncbi:hypothetical protein HAX54_028725 [Datura stramonium]|uniref:Uncharacterized protein n=1 Tax=Datura stramonium TaxID=4076 RepID=A0ABS8V7W2_DATST|nr:hypothetical protein [Datura stramonium]
MKLSKSILSPSHTRDQPLSLPTSLSRRLRANGSIKGGQSPATFPTSATGKKRGSGFENPEPSSPKVTCIGQVKMKTKKKVRQSRSLSKRRSDISFRKLEQAPEERGLLIQNQRSSSVHFQPQDQCAAAAHRNQRWVHLPLTIYEALREFSCLFPCRSSCFSTNEKEKEGKVNGSREVDNNGGQRACGDVVARWLVALHEGEAEETRGIELVVTNGKEEEERMEEMQSTMRSSRRHVFEGIEFKDHECVEMKEEKARVSICIPPKNALLLMRCRSDPMKMADITNRFWESPTRKETDEEEDKKEIGENDGVGELGDAQNFECNNEVEVPEESNVSVDLVENEENPEAVEVVMEMEIESSCKDEDKFKSGELTPGAEQEDEEKSEIKALVAEVNSIEQVPESIVDQTTENTLAESEKEEEDSSIQSYSSFSESSNGEYSRTENVLSEDAATMGVEEGEGEGEEGEGGGGEGEEEEEEEERFKSTIKKQLVPGSIWKPRE